MDDVGQTPQSQTVAAPALSAAASGTRAFADRKIRSVEAIPYAIPLVKPIKWARGEIKEIDNVLVVVTLGDGTQGIADAPSRPTILGDTQASIVAIVNEHFAPKLLGVDVFDTLRVNSVLAGFAGNYAANGAVDMACYDAQGKLLGVPCAHLLGGVVRPLTVNVRLRLASENEMLDEALEMKRRYGFKAFKVKGGTEREKDVRFLRRLRQEIGATDEISIDFNQGCTSQSLLEILPALEEVNIALIEEPIPARDGAGKLLVSRATRIPISGDDSCFTPDDVLHELKLGAIRSVVIKVARNGYTQGRDIVALARAFYTPIHNGSQADMHIGSAAAAQFACSYHAVHAHEFSSFIDATDHLVDRELEIRDGLLQVPDSPGIGLAIDPRKLAQYRLDH